ncbi:MAG: hypothetical protein Q9224_007007, partial [Gallowayella concinna]
VPVVNAIMETPGSHFNLLGLPNELLLRIIEYEVHMEDLENLTLCSKTIFNIARQSRKKHLENKRRFSTFSVGHVREKDSRYRDFDSQPHSVHPALALRLLVENDAVVDYCKILKLGDYMGSISYTADEEWEIRRDMDDQLRALQALRPFANVDLAYMNQLPIETLHDIAYSAILSTLRNLEVLEIDRCVWTVLRDDTTLEVVSNTHHRLTEVRVIGEPGDGESLSHVSVFASIPSVRKIYGSYVFGPDVVPLHAPSNLEDLYFERSGVDGPSFENLLTSVKKLKRLYYENIWDSGEPHTHEPRRLINSLRVHALESLETLSWIDSGREYLCDDNGEDMARPCSLREFKALKHVAIE